MNVYIPHVDVGITGVCDAIGNLQNPATLPDLFSVNTAIATPPGPITVTSVVPNLTTITDANVGTDKLRLDVYYSAATVGNIPTIKFTPDISSTLTLDYGFWIDPQYTHYRALYNVADANVIVNPITIKIEGARHQREPLRPGVLRCHGSLHDRHDRAGPGGAAPGGAGGRGPQQRGAEPADRHAQCAHEPAVRYQPGRSRPGLGRDVAGRVRVQGSGGGGCRCPGFRQHLWQQRA